MGIQEVSVFRGIQEVSARRLRYHFLSFWKSLSSTKLTYTQTLSAQIYALTLGLNADVSENTLPFVSQSINTTLVTMTYHKAMTGSVPLCPLMFSWCLPVTMTYHSQHSQCPSLSPRVLLVSTYSTLYPQNTADQSFSAQTF